MPSVSAASAVMPSTPSMAMAKASRNSALRPPRPLAAQGHGGFPARQQHDGLGKGRLRSGNFARHGGMHLRHVARFALDGVGEDRRLDALPARQRRPRPRATGRPRRWCATRVARQRPDRPAAGARLSSPASSACGMRAAGRAVERRHICAPVRACRPAEWWDRRPPAPDRRPARPKPPASPPAPGAQCAARRPPLMVENWLRIRFITAIGAPEASSARLMACSSSKRQPRRRRRQQRRAAARNQRHHQVVGAEARHRFHDAPGSEKPGFVGHRMGRLDDLDALAGRAIAVARDHQPVERAVPGQLEGPRHLRRRLAGADHDGAPRRLRRQVEPDRQRRLGLRPRRCGTSARAGRDPSCLSACDSRASAG